MRDTARRDPDSLLTLDEVAEMARVDPTAVRDAVRDRKLASHQQRGATVVRVGDVRRWLARR